MKSPTPFPQNFKFIDLFAGIGGIRIAFENVGGTCVYTSEWDKDCQTTYEINFGDKPDGDITKVDPKKVPNHDILTGGFPCQSFSIIGKRLGVRDERGTLFWEVERILKEKQPYAFLLENVRQLTTIDKGETFATMLKILDDLGYYTHWKVLNALDYGIPQKRERVMIVGFKQNHPFTFPAKKASRKTLEEILEPDVAVDKKHFISEHVANKLKSKVDVAYEYATVWHENKSGHIGIHEYSCALRANASYNYLLVNGKRRLTPRENLRLMGFPDTFKIAVNDGAIRKQAGNSVVIPMIQAVAEEMMQALKQAPIEDDKTRNKSEDYEKASILSLNQLTPANYAKQKST